LTLPLSRRQFLAAVPAALAAQGGLQLNRRAIVTRHNPTLHSFDVRAPLSVGNGQFAFTADPTGLQTFPQLYEKTLPLCTQAQWGWHTTPNPTGKEPNDFRLTNYDTFGRPVGYPTSSEGQKELYDWLRENPHRLHLGRIGFVLSNSSEVGGISQTLDLWAGILRSEFQWNGQPVVVETCCHPALDLMAVSIRGRIPVAFEFPYGSPAMNAADWSHPEKHRTTEVAALPDRIELSRQLDSDSYSLTIAWQTAAVMRREGPHRFVLLPASDRMEFVCAFRPSGALPTAVQTQAASREHWSAFWSNGGAVELPGCPELERRVVLSQYLTAIQCSGALPPQETGLTCNSWYGKFHLEMHYWHAAHFAAWGRAPLLERSLPWYNSILPSARERARSQGYAGTRWPKMTAPDGRESPSPIGPLLIWQQPHPIAMAEWCYRARPTRETLDRHRDIVFASADFLASFAHFEPGRNRYVLGPPVIPAQENHPPRETWNPTFELEYFAGALGIAQQWRRRLGLNPQPHWDDVRARLAALPVKDGVYLAHENCPQTYTERNRDHPSMLAALGMLGGSKVDRETMRRTLRKVFAVWQWADTWGWDFPMVAMTAASLGERSLVSQALLMDTPKNTWLANGHNWQRANLPVYLPGNGALLLAIAHPAHTGAFPESWNAHWEGLSGGPLY
jgi:protein-glucosylgalactosylhydroxylysine glucosidase